MKTGVKISRLREQRKMSQEQLADLVGVSQVTVGNWEQGKSIKHEHLKKVSQILEVPVDFLLDDTKKIYIQKNRDNSINGYEITVNTPNYIVEMLFEKLDKLIEAVKKNN